MKKTRKQAAIEIFKLQKCHEVRPLSLSTVYRCIRQLPNGNWHLVGKALDYTV